MRISSLRTRILVLTAVPSAVLLVGFLVGTLLTAERVVRRNVQHSLSDAGSVFVKLLAIRKSELMTMASVTARDPRFFATFSIPEDERGPEFSPTMEGVLLEFLRITGADFIEVSDGRGNFVAYMDRDLKTKPATPNLGRTAIQEALGGTPTPDFYRDGAHLVVAAVAPVFVSQRIEAVLRLGSFFDREFVDEVKGLTGAEVSLVHAGAEVASTFPEAARAARAGLWPAVPLLRQAGTETLSSSAVATISRGGTRYLALRVRMNGASAEEGFDAYLGRELQGELQPMVNLSLVLGLAGIAAILVTVLLAIWVAARTTGHLAEMVRAAEELQKGNYDQPLVPRGVDEVAFLAKSFSDMRETLRSYVQRLRNLDQMKSNFIALAAHELKTPLTVVTGFNEMSVSGSMGEVPESIRETTEGIQRRLWDLNRLVQNMMDLSRFEQGLFDFKLQDVDLGELATDVAEKLREDLKGRFVEVTAVVPRSPCVVRADSSRIEQALGHLLDNAIRATPDGGSVEVRLEALAGEAVLIVQDTGIGIPSDEIEWVFEKAPLVEEINQHSSGRLQFGSRGLGLGLALCRAIVEGHGGRVRARSALGRGSEFTIVLALQPAPVPAGAGDGEVLSARKPRREEPAAAQETLVSLFR